MQSRSTSVVSLLLVAAYVATTASAQPLQPIGAVAGWDDTIVTDVSDDGEVVIGFVRNYGDQTSWSQAFRWEDGEITLLGLLPGHGTSEAYDLSADGSVVVGISCEVDGLTRDCRAVRWSGTVAVELPFDDPENDFSHQAYAVSADGSIIAGFLTGWDMSGTVRWAGGQAPVRATSSFLWAWPHGISADGSVIVASTSIPQPGDLYDYGSEELYRISGQSVSPLPLPAGRSAGAVFGVSGDGSVAVGSYRTETQNSRPIFWGPDGVEELPLPDSAIGGMATVVSHDGSVIAGEYMLEGFERYVAIWRDGVFSDVEQELAARGVDLAGDFLSTPEGISADGTVIVGRGLVDGQLGYRAELNGVTFTRESAFMEEDSLFWPDTSYALRWIASTAEVVEIHASLALEPDPGNDDDWPIVVATGLEASAGLFEWTVPVQATSPTVHLRIRDADDPAVFGISKRARVRYGWHLTRVVTDGTGEKRYEAFAPERHAWQDGLTTETWNAWRDGYARAFAEKRDEVVSDLMGRRVETNAILDEALWSIPLRNPFTFEGEPTGLESGRRWGMFAPSRGYTSYRQAGAARVENRNDGHFRLGTPSWRGWVHAFGREAVYGGSSPATAIGLDPERAEVSPVGPRIAGLYTTVVDSEPGMCYGLAMSSLLAFHDPEAFADRYRELLPGLQPVYELASLPITPGALDVIASAFTTQFRSLFAASRQVASPLHELMGALESDEWEDDFTMNNGYHSVLPYRIEKADDQFTVLIHDRTYPSPAGNTPFPNGSQANLNARLLSPDRGEIYSGNDIWLPDAEQPADLLSPLGAPPAQGELLVGNNNEMEFSASAGKNGGALVDELQPITVFRNDPTLPPIGYAVPEGAFEATIRVSADSTAPVFSYRTSEGVTYGFRGEATAAGDGGSVTYVPGEGLTLVAPRDGSRYVISLSNAQGDDPSVLQRAEVGPFLYDAGHSIRWHWEDASTGAAAVRLENGGEAQAYSIVLSGGNDYFVADDVSIPAGAVHRIRPTWASVNGESVTIEEDADGDGTVDRTFSATNALPTSAQEKPDVPAPDGFELHPLYPNPTSEILTIKVVSPASASVQLDLFDVLGRRIWRIHNGPLPAGSSAFTYDARHLPAGLYVVRMSWPGGMASRTVSVLR